MNAKTKRTFWATVAATAVLALLAGCAAEKASIAAPGDPESVPIIIDVDIACTMTLAADTSPTTTPSAAPQPAVCLAAGR